MTETTRRAINDHLLTFCGELPMNSTEEAEVDLKFGLLETVCLFLNEAYFVAQVRGKERGRPVEGLSNFSKRAEKDGCSPFPIFNLNSNDFDPPKSIFIGIV